MMIFIYIMIGMCCGIGLAMLLLVIQQDNNPPTNHTAVPPTTLGTVAHRDPPSRRGVRDGK